MKSFIYKITTIIFLLSLGCTPTPRISADNQFPISETSTSRTQPAIFSSPTVIPSVLSTLQPTNTIYPTPTAIPIREPSVKDFVELQTLGRDSLTSYAVSPDGIKIAVAGVSGLQIYDISTMSFENHWSMDKLAQSISWSPDHKLLATTQNDKTVTIWDPSTGEIVNKINLALLHPINDPRELDAPISWSPDGKQFFTGGLVWNTKNWKAEFAVKGAISGVLWSPDNRFISTNIRVESKSWTRSGIQLPSYDRLPLRMAWSPNGRYIAANLASSYSDNITIWEPISGKTIYEENFPIYIKDIVWSPDSSSLAFGITKSNIDYVEILNIATLKISQEFETKVESNELYVRDLIIIWSPNGEHIITGHEDGFVRIWDIDGSLIKEFQTNSNGIYELFIFSSQLSKIISVGDGNNLGFGKVQIWSFPDGQLLDSISSSNFYHISWSRDSSHLIAEVGETSSSWNVMTGHHELDIHKFENTPSGVAWSADEYLIAYAKKDSNKVIVWDKTHGNREFRFGNKSSKDLAWSQNKHWLAVAGFSGVSIWDSDSWQELFHIDNECHVSSIDWSADGELIAFVDVCGNVKIFNSLSQEPIQSIYIDKGLLDGVSISPDKTCITFSDINAIYRNEKINKVYGIASGELKFSFDGGEPKSWSRDGTWLATSDGDTSLKILNVKNSENFYLFKGHEKAIMKIEWSSDGSKVATLGADGTVRIWGAPGE